MDQIKAGYVSDVVDGPPLYTERGLDKHGLMRYACNRGTSSVEGSCHFNIIRKFSSFNAGPRLTNMALYDYRLYHNINVGSKNRHGIMHKSHYSPWLAQAINALRFAVGHPLRNESYFGNTSIENISAYDQTKEKFGIIPVPGHIKNDFLMLPYDPTTYFARYSEDNRTKLPSHRFLEKQRENFVKDSLVTRISEDYILALSALPVVKLPNVYYASFQYIYRYLSEC